MAGADNYRQWKNWNADKFGACSNEEALYFSRELNQAAVRQLEGASLIEIGFGNGNFASWATSRGCHYLGTEIDPTSVACAKACGIHAVGATLDLAQIAPAASQDAVVAFDVLEHLTHAEIIELLTSARSVLKPGGLLLLRFPSGDSPFARQIQYGDMTHKSVIGSSMVRQIAAMVQLDVVQVRRPEFPIMGMGAVRALRRAAVFSMQSVAAVFVRYAFHGGQRTIISPDMVAVLRKPAGSEQVPG